MLEPEILDERNRRWDEPFGDTPLDDKTVARVLSLPDFKIVTAGDFQKTGGLCERCLSHSGNIPELLPAGEWTMLFTPLDHSPGDQLIEA